MTKNKLRLSVFQLKNALLNSSLKAKILVVSLIIVLAQALFFIYFSKSKANSKADNNLLVMMQQENEGMNTTTGNWASLLWSTKWDRPKSLRVAVLAPFIKSQLWKLFIQWKRWMTKQDGFPSAEPCSQRFVEITDGHIEVSYVMFYHQDLDVDVPESEKETQENLLRSIESNTLHGTEDDWFNSISKNNDLLLKLEGPYLKSYLQKVWEFLYEKPGQTSHTCLTGGIHFVSARTPPILDKTHPDGPCYMFFNAYQQMKELNYDFFFLMEPDVIPIRDFWMEALVREILKSFHEGETDVWQIGSLSHCGAGYGDIAARRDVHMNGNSLYNTRDDEFSKYIERMKEFYPAGMAGVGISGCATGFIYEGGYDHTLYRYRAHPAHWDDLWNYHHKFQYTDVIQNRCEDVYDPWELGAKYPNTYLVHSKSVFYTQEERTFRNIYKELTADVIPDAKSEESKLTLSMLKRKMNREKKKNLKLADLDMELAIRFCFRNDYVEHVNYMGHDVLHPLCTDLCSRMKEEEARKIPFNICDPYTSSRVEGFSKSAVGKVYLWTADFHASPIGCNMPLLKESGFEVHAEVDYVNCVHFEGTCKNRLKVLKWDLWNGVSLDPCPNKIRRDFYYSYWNDLEMQRVDAVICSHPVANCELYMPLNKTIIIYATTRVEFGRNDEHIEWRKGKIGFANKYRWREWISNLIKIGKNPRNIIAANNLYDVNYIKYHTGLDVQYIPSWCGDKWEDDEQISYTPSRPEILIGPYRDSMTQSAADDAWKHPVMQDLVKAISYTRSTIQFKRLKEIYPTYKMSNIAAHPAIVLLPYQVSVMSFFEFYRMNIPIFVPSKKLLTEWHMKHEILSEMLYGSPERMIQNDDFRHSPYSKKKEDLEFWIQFSDYYVFPHVSTFDSWEDLILKLEKSVDKSDLYVISNNMKKYNQKQREGLKRIWGGIRDKILTYSGGPGNSRIPLTIEEGLAEYDIPLLGMDIVRNNVEECPLDEKSKKLARAFPKFN